MLRRILQMTPGKGGSQTAETEQPSTEQNHDQTSEGFICPQCMKSHNTAEELFKHYDLFHDTGDLPAHMAPTREDLTMLRQEVQDLHASLKEERWFSGELKKELDKVQGQLKPTDVPEDEALTRKLNQAETEKFNITQMKDLFEQKAAQLATEIVDLKCRYDEERSLRLASEQRLERLSEQLQKEMAQNQTLQTELLQRPGVEDVELLQKELIQVQTLMDQTTRERENESERIKEHYEQLQANYTTAEAVLMVRQAEEVAQQITQQEQQAPLAVQAVKQKRFVKKGGKPQGERSGGQRHGYQGESKCNRDTAVEMGLVKRVQQVKAAAVHQGTMKTDPVKIHLRDDAVPHAVHTARRVPLPLLSKVQAELQRMEEHGVIVKVTQPTEWCAPMVPVLKPSGAFRICVGLQKLNENLKRETYQLPTTDETLAKLAGSTKYLVGMDKFRLITDHKPLVPLINSKDLDAVPVRCQRLLMRLMRFNAKAEYAPGKTLVISDALSRSPLKESYSTTEAVIASHVNAVTHSWPVSQSKLDRIRTATQEDPQLQHVRKLIRDGWPKRTHSAQRAVTVNTPA
uniref:C2H2-type domain-containing protein n=1 Tax=Knipowitschia caucasica TaxID=637954 RepID=A0AAV2L3T1_KNICA